MEGPSMRHCPATPRANSPPAEVDRSTRPVRPPGELGILVPFLPMTVFDFTFLTGGASATIVIHPCLHVTDYYSAKLIVRVHEISMVATQTLTLFAYGTDPSPSDTRDFALSITALYAALTSSVLAGSIVTGVDTDLLPYLKMVVTADQGNLTGGKSLVAVLSADLLLRE